MLLGEWQVEHPNGSTRILDYGDVVSNEYFIRVLRDLATRENASSRPVGVIFNPVFKSS